MERACQWNFLGLFPVVARLKCFEVSLNDLTLAVLSDARRKDRQVSLRRGEWNLSNKRATVTPGVILGLSYSSFKSAGYEPLIRPVCASMDCNTDSIILF